MFIFSYFITAPLLKIKSIKNCVNILRKYKKYDSIFTCKLIYSWFWYKGKPVNYKPKILPRSQDATPIVNETTGLYGVRKKALKKFRCRIGKSPYFYEVSDEESIDLDNKKDFEFFETYFKKKLVHA